MITFAEDLLEIELLPWQKWLLIHMLELLPDDSLRFRTVIVLVARQNGKSTLSQIVALWFMYVYGVALVLGTAQDLDTAEEVWQGAVDLVEEMDEEDQPVRPELHALLDRVVMVNGKKSLNLTGGERYKVKAANRRAGRGLSGDVILLDELREHQSWDAWGAITKTTMARSMALILALSNAGDATSIVLRYLRQMTIRALVDQGHEELRPELLDDIVEDELTRYAEEGIEDAEEYANEGDDSIAIFEWSAVPGCDRWDRDAWAMANPSMGYTITERTIASACKTDPEWVFRTEVLCQWSSGSLEGPFPPGAWEGGIDQESQIVGDVVACVDVSVDRGTSFIAFAGKRADGLPHVEVVAQRAGTDWVKPWLTDPKRADLITAVTGQHRGAPVSSILPDLAEAGLNVVEWSGSDLTGGTGAFYDLVRGNGVKHLPWPALDIAAATAVPKVTEGGAFMWDRKKSPNDVAPLIAAIGAVWLLNRPVEVPTESAYEHRGVLTV